jgi:hypothetical protein
MEIYKIEVNEDISDWDAVYRYILRGDIAEAIDLLVSFKLDKDESKSVELLCNLLKEYKNVQNETDVEDWKRKCALQLESNQAKPELTHIYFLVMGNSDYIKRSGTFFDQLVGLVRYCGLYASKSEITALAGSLDVSEFHDRYSYICAGLLLGRIDDALGACDEIWIQTHLGHLFLVLGVREDSNTSVNNSLDYEVIVDPIYQMANAYAQHIADKYNMWTQAVVYINLCIPNRVVWIKTLLEHEKAKHIPLLNSVLETVDEYSINHVVSYIHKVSCHLLKCHFCYSSLLRTCLVYSPIV